ncbi:MAG: NADH-quinone oxidoreductase subunit C [Nocardioides sp.]
MSASEHADGSGIPLDLPAPSQWRKEVVASVRQGGRFAGMFGTSADERGCVLTALVAAAEQVLVHQTLVTPGAGGRLEYRSLTPRIPGAFWYERALHDLSGVMPLGHPRLDPLLMPREEGSPAPMPGAPAEAAQADVRPVELPGPVDLMGRGMFTLPLGPVRSGVFESIELLIETPGEDIPHLNVRPHYKHRGVAKQFEGRSVRDAVLVAERVEGISTVAHAVAFCEAVERLSGVRVPAPAQALRVVHAELERVANHLDVTMRLADAAGLAVATSRFGWHKEAVLRLVSRLCGSRFGRGVVVPGGVTRLPTVDHHALRGEVAKLGDLIRSDLAALQSSASFLDRIRGTGPLPSQTAARHGALGPIGRASDFATDVRRDRPYGGYLTLAPVPIACEAAGDALARARVRWREIETSLALVGAAVNSLHSLPRGASAVPVGPVTGVGIGWAESAQGEVLHVVDLEDGVVRRAFARSPSFHNLVLLHDVFAGDIFTDLPFIEASFGLGYAGVAM